MKTEEKILKWDLSFTNLVREAECEGGGDGWKLPIWARIQNDEILLSLGEPVSAGTSFVNSNGEAPSSWVGDIDSWSRDWNEGEAEEWAETTGESPEDFNPEIELESQIDQYSSFYHEEEWEKYRIICSHFGLWEETNLDWIRKEYGTDCGFPARYVRGIDLNKIRKEYGTDYENIPENESIIGQCTIFALENGYDVFELC